MTDVDLMIDDILNREGGFVNHPDDRVGATKYDFTEKTLSAYLGHAVLTSEVKSLSENVARDIYERNYFIAPGINRLPEPVQAFIFDCAVNHGSRRAIKFIQSVCNQAGYTPSLSEDGTMGPKHPQSCRIDTAEFHKRENRNLFDIIADALNRLI
ncbi:MAG: hypothetical protein OEY36_04645 [Gammaproteobacteria bacterium]|nr:hypothetical protein [Gammaproteobacteria bacterium]